jgi:ABC-type tungstate transport system permease subunit
MTTYLMYNLTIIVGPKEDPARVEGLTDLKGAHRKIGLAKAKRKLFSMRGSSPAAGRPKP